MREGATLYYLLTDHLGSTAITADSNGTPVAELRYKAWGENRYTDGDTPTAYTFTGQRLDNYTQLYQMGTRWYDARIGRWIQPDTIIPHPANPQSLNRYSYVYNNPLRYIDPTGYLTEDQIMTHFDAKTWEEVLAFFEEGGELAGRWGWLATLRTALLGDIIQVFSNYEGLWPAWEGADVIAEGELIEREGQLHIQSEDTLLAANEVGWLGNAYGIRRSPSSPQYFGPYYAEKTYYHLLYDWSRVDQADIALDLTGIGLSPLDVTPAFELSIPAGIFIDLYSMTKDVSEWNAKGRPAPWEAPLDWAGFGADVLGMAPGVGAFPDAIGIVISLLNGFYWTP